MPSALKLTCQAARSECSSSDDNMMTSHHHDVASGLQMVHNKTIAHPSELIAEEEDAIELSAMCPVQQHRLIEYEDSQLTTSTLSPRTASSSDRETLESTLSASTTIDTFDRDSQSRSMRSRSYSQDGDQISLSMLSDNRCFDFSIYLSLYLSLT